MKTEKFSIYLGKIHAYFKKVYARLKEYKRLSHIRYRAWRLNKNTDKTMGDKLRTLAAKADAIEQYHNRYCNPDRVGRLDARYNEKWYNKHKNNLKKEMLLLNYNY